MPLSADPQARAKQLANLRPQAPLKHGAYSTGALKVVRERVLSDLLASFPNVRRDWLEIAAGQRARIELLQEYVDAVGVLRHRGHGTVFPAVERLQREEAAYAAMLARVEAMQGATSAAGEQLAGELEASRAAWEGK